MSPDLKELIESWISKYKSFYHSIKIVKIVCYGNSKITWTPLIMSAKITYQSGHVRFKLSSGNASWTLTFKEPSLHHQPLPHQSSFQSTRIVNCYLFSLFKRNRTFYWILVRATIFQIQVKNYLDQRIWSRSIGRKDTVAFVHSRQGASF